MTIFVATTDEEMSFDADGWETLQGSLGDEGNLFITKGDEAVAEFAKGVWQYVYEVKDEPAKRKSREWGYPYEVPSDEFIIVKDANGVEFTNKHTNRDLILYPTSGEYREPIGPFVEVLNA